MQSRLAPIIIAAVFVAAGCATTPPRTAEIEQAIAQTLDELHQRASAADFEGYFSLYAQGAVFLGTDKKEYWPLADFKEYTRPHFSKGNGWTYTPIDRQVHINGSTAWFEERLHSEKYGEVRGTGVLVQAKDGWKVAQYNLTLPIPNKLFSAIAEEVVRFYAPRE